MKYVAILVTGLALFASPLHAQSLTIPLTFTNGSVSQVITVGFEPGATDAYDIGVDNLAPPAPPAQTFDVRAILDNIEYYQDLRDTTETETLFHISLTPASGSTSFLLEWDSAALASLDGTFEITDDMNGMLFGPIDMQAANSVDLLSAQALLDNGIRIRIDLGEDMPNNVSIDEEQAVAQRFTLNQNYPNPFRQHTDITFSLTEAEHVTLVVYDLLGKEKATLVDTFMAPGTHTLTWNAASEASGMYYYTLSAGSQVSSRSMVLTR